MKLDKRYLVWALSYATVGLALGIYMAASQDHAELVTHTHILLIGFLVSFVYAIIHRLWLLNPGRALANLQFVVHQAGAITISVALFLLYGNLAPASTLEPILAMLLMLYRVIRFDTEKARA